MKTPHFIKYKGRRTKDENSSGLGSEFILYPVSFIV
jgi:hypothetical protein